MLPGLRLRQVRERLGLTYRDVESASYELASRRGSSDFILHISRLADIENRNVVPGLHYRAGEKCWLSGGYLMPVGQSGADPRRWQITCSWQF